MSATLWAPGDRAIDLGPTLELFGAFKEIGSILGSKKCELGGVILSLEDEVSDEWLSAVAAQAQEVLDGEHKLGEHAKWVLEQLIGGAEKLAKSSAAETDSHAGDRPWKLGTIQCDEDGITAYLVDGEYVETYVDPDYTQGANGYARPQYCPQGEVWIDDRQPGQSRSYTLLHELTELRAMRDRGLSYDEAHEEANVAEQGARQRDRAEKLDPRADLRKWQRMATAAIRRGRQPRRFESGAIPPVTRRWVEAHLAAGDLAKAFRRPSRKAMPRFDESPRMGLPLAKLQGWTARKLKEWYEHYLAQAVARFPAEKLAKDAPGDWADPDVADEEVDELASVMAEMYQAGVDESVAIVGAGRPSGVAHAQERAARLLGKRIVDGEIVDQAEESKWFVPGTVRDKVRAAVAETIEEGDGIGELRAKVDALVGTDIPYRSLMVARTEGRNEYNTGAVGNFEEMGVETVEIVDGGQPTSCDDCNERNGSVVSTAEFLEISEGSHPNCTIMPVPVVGDLEE